ncbi:hypothetical protein MPTK1_4g09240 [Marchantia polymorpha subsp. ruderalis]|uniref:Uncharacterized protein n=2 Tax=Marchantia polymorpha TaxID=3197 RepID=A0AAF6B810_MARPO|nr:hypothetical protein MARPO_0112s0024 [Marchantia polymorpha]BBN08144.1 hypothetical protein Mp_4g09240 [Marchantia polymorpha subsp. ruderalis]|eukprot:PTQ31368.1 hypothetical protein MARPO_0112s0024 [Marchantia polymorpha]
MNATESENASLSSLDAFSGTGIISLVLEAGLLDLIWAVGAMGILLGIWFSVDGLKRRQQRHLEYPQATDLSVEYQIRIDGDDFNLVPTELKTFAKEKIINIVGRHIKTTLAFFLLGLREPKALEQDETCQAQESISVSDRISLGSLTSERSEVDDLTPCQGDFQTIVPGNRREDSSNSSLATTDMSMDRNTDSRPLEASSAVTGEHIPKCQDATNEDGYPQDKIPYKSLPVEWCFPVARLCKSPTRRYSCMRSPKDLCDDNYVESDEMIELEFHNDGDKIKLIWK